MVAHGHMRPAPSRVFAFFFFKVGQVPRDGPFEIKSVAVHTRQRREEGELDSFLLLAQVTFGCGPIAVLDGRNTTRHKVCHAE